MRAIHLLSATATMMILRPEPVHSAVGGLLRNWKRGGVSGSDGSDGASLPSVVVAVEESATSSFSRSAKPLLASVASASSSRLKMNMGPKLGIEDAPLTVVEEEADYWDRFLQTAGDGGGSLPTAMPTLPPTRPDCDIKVRVY